jgi:threonine dehydrogenase-like Zn-dependent dehydrogenase
VLEACRLEVFDPSEGLDRLSADHFAGRAIGVAFECSGVERGLEACLTRVARGGAVVVVAVYAEPPRTDMVAVQDHELNVYGSLMYTWDDFREAALLVAEGLMCLQPLQTHHVSFEDWAHGYGLIDDPASGAMKVIVDMA